MMICLAFTNKQRDWLFIIIRRILGIMKALTKEIHSEVKRLLAQPQSHSSYCTQQHLILNSNILDSIMNFLTDQSGLITYIHNKRV